MPFVFLFRPKGVQMSIGSNGAVLDIMIRTNCIKVIELNSPECSSKVQMAWPERFAFTWTK